jgi:hypothetical protein
VVSFTAQAYTGARGIRRGNAARTPAGAVTLLGTVVRQGSAKDVTTMSRAGTSTAAKAIPPNATHDALNHLCPRRRAIWSANPPGTRTIRAAMATATGNGTGCCAGEVSGPRYRIANT